jgi:hypothetical protein
MVIREPHHRLDTLFGAKTLPIAVGFELRSELRNRPLCIRFHDLALRTYSSCCVPQICVFLILPGIRSHQAVTNLGDGSGNSFFQFRSGGSERRVRIVSTDGRLAW